MSRIERNNLLFEAGLMLTAGVLGSVEYRHFVNLINATFRLAEINRTNENGQDSAKSNLTDITTDTQS